MNNNFEESQDSASTRPCCQYCGHPDVALWDEDLGGKGICRECLKKQVFGSRVEFIDDENEE